HRAGGRDDADAPRAPRGIRPRRTNAETRPRERGRVLHPRWPRLRGPRRRALRLVGGRCGDRAHELRAPAFQRRSGEARARAGAQAQAHDDVHEPALPEVGDSATDRGHAGRPRVRAAPFRGRPQPPERRRMRTLARGLAALAAALLLVPAAAQVLAGDEGADRIERIAAAAKKEGTLTL